MELLYAREFLVFAGFGLGLWLSLLASALYYGGGATLLAKAPTKKNKNLIK